MYHTDKIAILLAAYQGEKYISEQIDSILAQTEQNWMLYIHDDGSKDGTMRIIESYAKQYPNDICVVEGASTGGAKQNFFYLFHQVEAPYYMCCDQDDVWLPDKIEKTKKEMLRLEHTVKMRHNDKAGNITAKTIKTESNKAGNSTKKTTARHDQEIPCLVFTELKVVDEKLNVLHEKMSWYQGLDCKTLSINRALIQNVATGCTMMINRKLRDELTRLTEYTDVLMHDWWAMLVATRFGQVSYVEDATILYRQHGENGVGAKNANTVSYMIQRMNQGAEIKESLLNTRKQAARFADLYREGTDSLIRRYGELGKKSKISRILFYIKNDVKKSTLSKNMGLLIWG